MISEEEKIDNGGISLEVRTNCLDLKTKYLGRNIYHFSEVASTNEVANTMARNGAPEGTVIIAESQTNGQGRLNRKWFSPKDKGLWFTVILRPQIQPARASQLTLVAAIAIATAIYNTTNLSPGIKWPNDLLLNGRKFCGILSEGQLDDKGIEYVILGIGLNVNLNSSELSSEIKSTATSLKIEKGQNTETLPLLQELLYQIEKWYETWLNEGFEPIRIAWKEKNITIGQNVRVHSCLEIFQGVAIDIDKDGSLLVKDQYNKIRSFNSGDVRLTNKS